MHAKANLQTERGRTWLRNQGLPMAKEQPSGLQEAPVEHEPENNPTPREGPKHNDKQPIMSTANLVAA